MLNPLTVLAVGDNGVHLAGDLKEVYWGSAAFAVLVILFLWKGLGPIKENLRGRTERIRSELADAQSEREAAESAVEAKADTMPDVGQERSRIRREALETAEKLKKDLISKAKKEAASIVERGHLEVATMRNQAASELASQVSTLTKEAAEMSVAQEMTPQSHANLIDAYITKVGQLA